MSSFLSLFKRAWNAKELAPIEHGIVEALKSVLYVLLGGLIPLVIPQIIQGHFILMFSHVNWLDTLISVAIATLLLAVSRWYFARKGVKLQTVEQVASIQEQKAVQEIEKLVTPPEAPKA